VPIGAFFYAINLKIVGVTRQLAGQAFRCNLFSFAEKAKKKRISTSNMVH